MVVTGMVRAWSLFVSDKVITVAAVKALFSPYSFNITASRPVELPGVCAMLEPARINDNAAMARALHESNCFIIRPAN